MWSDNETAQDYLNFGTVAATVAEIIENARDRPVSIGVSGVWGVGKSSLIKLVHAAIEQRAVVNGGADPSKFIFVEFNAWLYQGYDDARTALIEVVASALTKEAESRKTGLKKATALMKRVEWFRVMKLTAGTAASIALGLPPTGLIGEAVAIGKKLLDGEADRETLEEGGKIIGEAHEQTKGLLRDRQVISPPKEIEALRRGFEETLKEMGVTLVVLIDDLDRCLPETTISTLEAIRLLLFLKHTAFVIAADDQMIKHAVKRHFQGVEDKLVTNYFDKLIQVPIRVPPLGTQEVRAYMMLLFIENSSLEQQEKENLREGVCTQLSKTWQGSRVDTKFIATHHGRKLPDDLLARLDLADRLAPLMTSAEGIAGNPRLIKRFLNALSIRMSMARAQGVSVDESELVKVLLFERSGSTKAYADLVKAVTESDGDGKPKFLAQLETVAATGNDAKLQAPWDDKFLQDWLRLPPSLSDRDLRAALYVSREHAPLITAEDRLSAEAADLLEGLLEQPAMAATIKPRLAALSRSELVVLMDRVLARARQQQEWGTPPILEALLTLSDIDPAQGQRVAAFMRERPGTQIKAGIIPKLADRAWSTDVFDAWLDDVEVGKPAKTAINNRKKNGDIAIK
ncbi:ATPase [Pararobbsia alpina]|uniref:KAP family P-loop NTPase fold protein n=1 Tax=Pararobbsia alpina TaxID=621374 RepID=UPI0039A444DB